MTTAHSSDRWKVKPGTRVALSELDPGSNAGAPGDRAATEALLPELREQLAGLQDLSLIHI